MFLPISPPIRLAMRHGLGTLPAYRIVSKGSKAQNYLTQALVLKGAPYVSRPFYLYQSDNLSDYRFHHHSNTIRVHYAGVNVNKTLKTVSPSAPLLGVVKWFNGAKGFGFLQSDDYKAPDGQLLDIFVHFTALNMQGYRELQEGQKVRFDLYGGEKGPTAQNVEVL